MAKVAISARIESSILEKLEKEFKVSGVNRNMMLNRAAQDYITLLDLIRLARAKGKEPANYEGIHGWLKYVEFKISQRWHI